MALLRRAGSVLPLGVCLLLALACTQSDVVVVDVARVDVSPAQSSVLVGQQTQLTATVRASGGQPLTGRTVTWSSDDPAVASTDATGRVSGVAVGTATIRASSEGASGTATVTVAAGPVPAIGVNPDRVTFAAVQNGATPGDRTVAITNAGTGVLSALSRAVRYPAGAATGWLTAVLGGTTAPTSLVLSADQAGLAPGTHRGYVDISAPDAQNSPATIEVELTVATPAPAIGLGTTSVSFGAAAGGSNPATQSVAVTNAGGGTLGGLLAAVSFAAGQPGGWLTATLGAATAPTTLQLSAATGTLPVGVYTATVRVSSSAAQNSPQDVNVTFTVGAPPPAIATEPSSLGFTAIVGEAAPAQVVTVTNSGGGSLTGLGVSVTYPGGQPSGWVTTSLAGSAAPTTLSVAASAAGLAGGTYGASVSITSPVAGNSPRIVNITLEVIAPPAAPSGLTATAASATRIDLTWNDNSADETGFQLERSVNGGAWSLLAAPAANATSYVDDSAQPATTYGYRVRACRGTLCSAFSATASATTPDVVPGTPGNVAATAVSPGRIDVAWDAPATGGAVVGYRVERRLAGGTFALVDSVGSSTRSIQDAGLTPVTSYGYRVQACNAAGCSPFSTEATATTPPLPPVAEAGGPYAGIVAGELVTLDGSASSDADGTIVSFHWEIDDDDEPTVLSGEHPTYRCLASGSFAILLTVTDNHGATDSDQASLTCTGALPGIAITPSSLTFTAVAGQPAAGTQEVAITNAGGGELTGLAVSVTFPGGQPSGWLTANLTSTAAPSTVVVGATAAGLAGGTYTASISITSPVATNSPRVLGVTLEVTAPPAAPSALSATAVTATRVDLAWTDNSADETGFQLERNVSGGAWSLLAAPAANVTSFTDDTALPATAHGYRVRACRDALCSAFTAPAVVTTPDIAPGPPASLSATVAGASGIDLAWDAPVTGGAVATYRVERRTAESAFALLATVGSSVHSIEDRGLAAATSYTYRVQACNAAGCSAFSPEATATTAALPPSIALAPSSLSFAANAGATAPAQEVAVSNGGGGALTGLSVSVTFPGGQPTGWLTANLTASTAPTTLSVGASAAGLAAGSYTATVSIASPVANNSPQVVSVTFEVTTPPAPPVAEAGGPYSGAVGASVTLDGSGSSDPDGTIVSYQWQIADEGEPTSLTGINPAYNCVTAGTFAVTLTVTDDDGATGSDGTVLECTAAGPALPGAPTNVQLSEVAARSVMTSWSAPAAGGILAWYRVERRAPTGPWLSASGNLLPTTTSHQVTGLTPSTFYRFRVQACNITGCTASPEVSATTLPDG